MERFLRIFGRIFDEYGLIFIGALIAISALIGLVAFLRRRKAGPKMPKPAKNKAAIDGQDLPADAMEDSTMAAMPEIDLVAGAQSDDALVLTMDDSGQAAPKMEIDVSDDMPMPDQLDQALAHQFDMNDGAIDELDDITIPKVGEAPPPRKSRFFSASWLHREHGDDNRADVYEDKSVMADNKKKRDAAAECARLAEIERNMMALRELYEAGLIAPEVYALKAREFAAQIH